MPLGRADYVPFVNRYTQPGDVVWVVGPYTPLPREASLECALVIMHRKLVSTGAGLPFLSLDTSNQPSHEPLTLRLAAFPCEEEGHENRLNILAQLTDYWERRGDGCGMYTFWDNFETLLDLTEVCSYTVTPSTPMLRGILIVQELLGTGKKYDVTVQDVTNSQNGGAAFPKAALCEVREVDATVPQISASESAEYIPVRLMRVSLQRVFTGW